VISQKNLDKFFFQMGISVLKKNILLKSYFYLKDDKDYVGSLFIKIHFICLSKHYMKSKKNYPQNIPKYTQKRVQCFLA
jgi:hypothetical protein